MTRETGRQTRQKNKGDRTLPNWKLETVQENENDNEYEKIFFGVLF